MADLGPMQVEIHLTVMLSLWDAFKLRLAGREYRERLVDELVLRLSDHRHPEDRA